MCSQYARQSGRSWWALRYSNFDDWVHEWDPEPASPNNHKDWPMLPKRNRQAVRLYCPNGKFAQLGDTHDATGRIFQFKSGARHMRLERGSGARVTQEVLAHVIGMLTGLNGECVLYAWEPLPEPPMPSDVPKRPIEQEWIAKSAEPGLYERAVAEWEVEIEKYFRTPQAIAWMKSIRSWEANAKGRLVGPIYDNVYVPTYQGFTGPLNTEYLGIDDGE
jgi:hypothetical protein